MPDGGAEPTVAVRVKPGSSRERVGGRHPGPYGDAVVVSVTARAVDGAATRAALKAVAAALGCKPRQMRLAAGRASRDKLIAVSDPPVDLADRVRTLLDR
jgi:uncharacterized protein YggU (UPF0235/DUF167 family)